MISLPQRKVYRYKIPTVYWDVSLCFEQALAKDTRHYVSMIQAIQKDETLLYEMSLYWGQFFDKHITQISNKRYYPKQFIFKKVKKVFIEKLYEDIQTLYHKPYDSIYEWMNIPTMMHKDWKKEKAIRTSVLNSSEKNIYDYTGTPICELDDKYTLEQIWFFHDVITRNYLENFDAWKVVNDRARTNKWLNTEQKQILEYIKQHSTYQPNQ